MALSNPSSVNIYNGIQSKNDYQIITESLGTEGILVFEDAADYRFLSFQISGDTFHYNASIYLEVSNDSLYWIRQGFSFTEANAEVMQITFVDQISSPGIGCVNLKGRHFRLVVAYNSGAGEIKASCYLFNQSLKDSTQESLYFNSLHLTLESIAGQILSQTNSINELITPFQAYFSSASSGLDAILFEKIGLIPRFSYADIFFRVSSDFIGSVVYESRYLAEEAWKESTLYKLNQGDLRSVTSVETEGNYIILLPVGNNAIRLRLNSYTSGEIHAYIVFRQGELPQQLIYLENIRKSVEQLRERSVPTARTPTLIQSSSSGSTPDNVVSVSIANRGSEPGLVLDIPLEPGDSLTWEAPHGDTLLSIPYDATNTIFLISALA